MDKLELIRDTYTDEAELDLILDKVLDITLNQYRLRLQRYEQGLHDFEKKYNLDSQVFHQHFEAGEMGDAMDFFEWAGLYELHRDLVEKIQRLETAV